LGKRTLVKCTLTPVSTEAVLHEAMQIQAHLAAQDKVLTALIDEMLARRDS